MSMAGREFMIGETLACPLWYIYVHFRIVFSHDCAAEQRKNRHRSECHNQATVPELLRFLQRIDQSRL